MLDRRMICDDCKMIAKAGSRMARSKKNRTLSGTISVLATVLCLSLSIGIASPAGAQEKKATTGGAAAKPSAAAATAAPQDSSSHLSAAELATVLRESNNKYRGV